MSSIKPLFTSLHFDFCSAYGIISRGKIAALQLPLTSLYEKAYSTHFSLNPHSTM